MTEENFEIAKEYAEKRNKCKTAIVYSTVDLPDEVRKEIKDVVKKWEIYYDDKFQALL